MISVLIPSRGRPNSLLASIASLFDQAARPDAVEAVIILDPDDTTALDVVDALFDDSRVTIWDAPERYGYPGLHRYYNFLLTRARGDWLLLWNDDARMLTPGWDVVIESQDPGFLWPAANHSHHANIFPAWPAAWSRALGHVSPFPHPDTYLQWLGEAAGLLRKIPVELIHDRADVTGGHDDQTYAEGRKLLGTNGMAPGFDAAAVRERAAKDAEVIRRVTDQVFEERM